MICPIFLIGEFKIPSQERELVAQRLETWFLNCEVAGSVPIRLRWCALLKSFEEREIAV